MDRTGNQATVGGSEPSLVLSDILSVGLLDIRPNNQRGTPLSSRTATMSLKSNAEPTPMNQNGGMSAVTQPERPHLPKDSEADGDTEDNNPDISKEDLADAAELRIYSHLGVIQMSGAIQRAKTMIPRNLALQRETIHQIQHFFFVSDTSNRKGSSQIFYHSGFLRYTTEKVQKVYSRYLATGDNETGMPSKAELLAIRFCNPNETAGMTEDLGGYLQSMNRADLTQVEGVEKREQTSRGALISHFDDIDDMKKRIRALEASAPPQELEHLTKKSDFKTAIQDFRVSVKGALDRRLSKDDLNKVTAKYDKGLDDLLKRSNADRNTAKELAENLDDALAKHAKDLNDLAEKQAQDLKDLENRFQASLRGTPLAGLGTITGQARKRPFADASDAGNRPGPKVVTFDPNVTFLDADLLDADLLDSDLLDADLLDYASHGDENQAKKRRVDDGMGKMDFSDIV